MAVQTKILKRTETYDIKVRQADGTIKTEKVKLGVGTLVGGFPGQIYDVAYGPVVHTTTLTADADIGSFVEGQGIIINAPEYALYGKAGKPLEASLTIPSGSVVSCMTAGHVWIQRKNLDTILAKMNAAVIWEMAPEDADDSSADSGDDLLVVEVNGMTAYGPGDSTDNG